MNSSSSSLLLSSSSSTSSAFTYDVFLSFRGEDTRKNFTGHLYEALKRAGINAFIDDEELPRGKSISAELIWAIEGSRVSVVVFSTNYGDSRWCLEELVKIMERRRSFGQVVLPVFYNVDPSDVRKQTGSFAEAFRKHEERFGSDSDKIMLWRNTLKEAGELSGWDLRNTADGHEAKFIKMIVDEVSRQLNSTYLFVALYPVGIDFRVQEMRSLLAIESDNNVRMIGIWGMGGLGKTTIAKAMFNEFYHSFEGRSFLANVRENWDQPSQRVRLQEQLLYDILKSKTKLGSVDRGVMVIKERLCRRKVLVIVDDVDHVQQLNAIARSRDWFGLGSRIIITTRDEHLLKQLEVDSIYMAKEMTDTESLELFSWHAFRRSYPGEGYFGLSRSVVSYCGGLPLALEVLGSFLFGRNTPEWESALEKLKRTPNDHIQKKLRISYDAFGSDDEVKDIFLDISCFFIGMDRDYVSQILDACGLHAEIGISLLLQRCFITIVQNKLMMHDLLRDMGREIVREISLKEPGKWSRLWLREDICDVLTKQTGTEQVEGLSLKMERLTEMKFSTQAFTKMKRLRLLQLNHVQITGSYEYLSKELRWLSWHGCSMKFLPNNFYQGNLVAISLKYSNLTQVWKVPQMLEKLKILNLSHSHNLTRTPDFSKLPGLRKLILKDCTSLYEIHQSIGTLDKLVFVNLKDCKILRSLPKDFYRLKSLESLIISGCSMFHNLDEDLGELASLTTLLADNTEIRRVPSTIVRLRNLKHLSLCGVKASTSNSLPSSFWSWLTARKRPEPVTLLPPSLKGLNSLTRLLLHDCNLTDDAIPKDIGSLSALVDLNLDNNNFSALPSSLRGLTKLRMLTLNNCTMLQSIPDLPRNLNTLFATNCTALEELPNMSDISGMQNLSLSDCHKLVNVPGLEKLFNSMGVLRMEGCNNISTNFKDRILQGWNTSTGQFAVFLSRHDIPEWFTYISEGNLVCFRVPQMENCSLESLDLCILYSSSPDHGIKSFTIPSLSVINHTKRNIFRRTALSVDLLTHRKYSLWQGRFSNKMFKLEEGDEVAVIFDFGPQFVVKKTGVYLLWDKNVDHKMIEYSSMANEDSIVPSDDQTGVGLKRSLDQDVAGPSKSSSCFDEDPSPKRLRHA
ncbi:TIR-NBS-LRR-like protein [Parasponia andersonii]|uniref:TIR-NBS-LRR-like protein n=1 Tax=Parasponia andersonii TaxID=3476 RepID=A0A2P5CSC9_PARAD|nr:TIR-NBS-LRR-like protein [Parasponia andersonii]